MVRQSIKGELICAVVAVTLLVALPVQAQSLNQDSVTHVVAWGETMFRIAQRYGTSIEAICAANGITNPSSMYVGQQLVIPTAGPTPNAQPAPATGEGTHVVGPGENLYRIALRYGTTVQVLAQLNGISNHDRVVAGQTLRIPGSFTVPATAYQSTQATTTHTVQPGETLAAIALRYDVTPWALVQTNNIANPSLIYPGQVLILPGGSGAASAPAPTSTSGGKRIVIDLSEQHLYAYQGETLFYSFIVSTGIWNSPTSTGTFSVLNKLPSAYASTWGLQMPYWLGIYWSGGLQNGIHALPILSNGQKLWDGYLGQRVSYGCVILSTEAAKIIYDWAEIGTPVIIRR